MTGWLRTVWSPKRVPQLRQQVDRGQHHDQDDDRDDGGYQAAYPSRSRQVWHCDPDLARCTPFRRLTLVPENLSIAPFRCVRRPFSKHLWPSGSYPRTDNNPDQPAYCAVPGHT